MSQDGIGIEPDRGAVYGDGQVELAPLGECSGKVRVGVSVIGLPLDVVTARDQGGFESLIGFSG